MDKLETVEEESLGFYKVALDAFKGPMDILLDLIDKAEIDIYDIPISLITEQFIEYIDQMEELDLDITSDFLVMAATLLEIKSKMLLPIKEEAEDGEEVDEIDPRDELVRRLIEYKKYKMAAEEFRIIEKIQSKVYYKPMEDLSDYKDEEIILEGLNINLLIKSISNILEKRNLELRTLDINEIQREEYTLEGCIDNIKNKLNIVNSFNFTELFDENTNKTEIIIYFLSALELIRMKYINIFQKEDFSDLIIIKRLEEEL